MYATYICIVNKLVNNKNNIQNEKGSNIIS